MGLFDTLLLTERVDLPEYDGEEHYKRVWWQTKSLTCGQDHYRLRPLYDDDEYYVGGRRFTGQFQLERREPPIQKQTAEGAFEPDDTELLWWNTVRPSCTLRFYNSVGREWYEYEIELVNGVSRGDFKLVHHDPEYWDEAGSRKGENYWRWYIDENGEPTIWGRDILVADVVEVLNSKDPDELFEAWALDAGEVHKALDYYRSSRSEFDVEVEDDTVRQWMKEMVQRMGGEDDDGV